MRVYMVLDYILPLFQYTTYYLISTRSPFLFLSFHSYSQQQVDFFLFYLIFKQRIYELIGIFIDLLKINIVNEFSFDNGIFIHSMIEEKNMEAINLIGISHFQRKYSHFSKVSLLYRL